MKEWLTQIITAAVGMVLMGAVSLAAATHEHPSTWTPQQESKETVSAKNGTTVQPPGATGGSPGVQVIGSISAKVIKARGRVSGFITVANRSGTDIDQVKVSAHIPEGFEFIGGRLDTEGETADPCRLDSFGVPPAPAVRCNIPGVVRAGEERALGIEWLASGAEAEQSVDATVQWTQAGPQGLSKSYRDISLGEISSRAWFEFPFTEYPALLPLVSGLLGGLVVAGIQRWMDFRSKRAEEKRAKDAKIEEEAREHTATTWEKMLPVSHEITVQHYVHIQSFVRSAVQELELYKEKSDKKKKATKDCQEKLERECQERLERAFLCLTLFDRRMLLVNETIGGAYFKNRMGEEIVGWAYAMYRVKYWDKDLLETRPPYSNLLRAIHPSAGLSDLLELSRLAQDAAKVSSSHTTKQSKPATGATPGDGIVRVVITDESVATCGVVRARFCEWVNNGDWKEAIPYLYAVRDVLFFEMNRPYRYWYGGKPERLSVSKPGRDAILSLGEGLKPEDELKVFQTKLKAYLEESEAGAYEC